MKEKLSEIKGALLTGVSYMLPFVIAGGILIALGFAIGGYDIPNSVEEYGNFASTIFWLGKKAFALMVPVLGTGTIMINKGFLKPWTYQPENNPKKSGCFFVLLC